MLMVLLPRLRWLLTGLVAIGHMSILAKADAASAGSAAQPGFNMSAVTLAEALTQGAGQSAPSVTANKETTTVLDSQPVLEQEAREGNREALAKEAQNPIANLISFPIQWNATPASQWAPRSFDPSAEANRTLNVWNVQPVVPFNLNKDFLLISRTIIPVIQRPLTGNTDIIGIGDINPSLFLVPRTNSRLQLGFGPTLVIPSATDVRLSSQRWSAGPAAVAVYTSGPLVAGMLANNIWSFAGEGGRKINSMLIQPFINYNLANGWYLASSPIITSDWTAHEGRGWTVPIGGGFGRIFRLGSQPFNASFQAFWNVTRPEVVGDRLLGPVTLRLQIQALFPTGG
jgi:hypothetical protein